MLLEKIVKYTDYVVGINVVISAMCAVLQLASGSYFQAFLCGASAAFNATAFVFIKKIDEEMSLLMTSMKKLEELSKKSAIKVEAE